MMKQVSGLMIWLCAVNFGVVKPHKLHDYIKDGMQIHVTFGIDFSGSADGKSVHLLPDAKKNYEHALNSMTKIFTHFDSDKKFDMFGYGANGGAVFGVCERPAQDVPQAYSDLITLVQQTGPANLAPAVQKGIEVASKYPADGKNYAVLVLLTDGHVADKAEAIAAIVKGSELPLSIVVVGVGRHDFSVMEMLDADKTTLESNGQKAKRDIVQFVPFNKVASEAKELVDGTLEEVPDQIASYLALLKA